ncbi:MAG: bifunctional metallophosphatase/5'-nucleotidase [Myxococcales bacterium]|nr:bifunctional metallophosphatase/5'-nucleotidase [Myxococcales bacterium]
MTVTMVTKWQAVTAAGVALALGLFACNGNGTDADAGGSTGDLRIALSSVPAGTQCLAVDVSGARARNVTFDLTPGAPASFLIDRLPLGLVTVSARSFDAPCAVIAGLEPSFVNEAPVTVRIELRAVAQVLLKLIRNGRLSVGIDFEPDSHVCAGVPDGDLCQGGNLRVQLLAFNDFHGQLSQGRFVSGRPVGGAAILGSYLKAAAAGREAQTLIVHAGDHVGASPAASALLQDEPSITFLNMLANESCTYADRTNANCNLVGTLGNHEFDEGRSELLRLIGGGNHPMGPYLESPYRGTRFPYISANVVDEATGAPLLPPYVVKNVRGVPVAFVGAVLETTPTIVTPTGVAGLKFLDEADAANSYVPELKAAGVRAIVLVIHQGGRQSSFTGPTKAVPGVIDGPDILDIIARLDPEFDVVVSGHAHSFTNAIVPRPGADDILVTQAFSASTAYADIELLVDPVSGDVVGRSAEVITTFSDVAPGNTPDPAIATLVIDAEARVAPLVNRVVGVAPVPLTRTENTAGESVMGNLIADAQRAATGTQFAFMNPGGIRADIDAGDITWGELFTVQPFGNSLVTMQLTGAQIKNVLEQQWAAPQPFPRIMKVSGLSYTWDAALPPGARVVEVRDAATNTVLDPTALYTITANNFMAAGGDNFVEFTKGLNQVGGDVDLDALIEYVEENSPVTAVIEGRIVRLN